jgi:AraC family transcriptional regulator
LGKTANFAGQHSPPTRGPTADGAALLTSREVAAGAGWCVTDVAYRVGAERRPLCGSVLLAPGALLLGNFGSSYECTFERSPGDRCINFAFTPACFEAIAQAVPGVRRLDFSTHRIPPIPAILPLAARAELQQVARDDARWEQLSYAIAGEVLKLLAGEGRTDLPLRRRDERRIADALRLIELRYAEPLSIGELAGVACMSPYHFMRTFRAVTGVTAYQYVLQTRLRQAAFCLGATREPIASIAFDAGFGDLSTFTGTFRRALGASPSQYRAAVQGGWSPAARRSAPVGGRRRDAQSPRRAG